MALLKARTVAAFLLLVIIASLLTASEGVKLAEGAFRTFSKRVRDSASKVIPSTSSGGAANVRAAAAAWDRQIAEGNGISPVQAAGNVPEPVWASGKVEAAAGDPMLLAAAKKLAHKTGGVILNKPQISALMMDAASKAAKDINPLDYERMSQQETAGYEHARQEFDKMTLPQKAAMLAKVTKDKSFLGKVKDKLFRHKFEVQKQMMVAAEHLNKDRDSNGVLNKGAVRRAINHANETYRPLPEEKEEDISGDQSRKEGPKDDIKI